MNKPILKYISVIGFCLLFAAGAKAGLKLETVTTDAFDSNINGVSFQQDALVTYNGYQYLTYWSRNRHVALGRKQLPDGAWELLELSDYRFETADAHYDISLGISAEDGALHLSFDQWSSEFRYRKSIAGLANAPQDFAWSAELFGPVQNHLTGTRFATTTYPRFVSSPSGNLLLLLRHVDC